jgi:hypothetical protein
MRNPLLPFLMSLALAACGDAVEGEDVPVDGDRDGSPIPDDCDDANAEIHPSATEVPYDGIDQDCDDVDLVDVDGDGYVATEVMDGDDCDDAEAGVHPGAAEVCGDAVDQDCRLGDLSCDEVDGDGDGFTPEEGDCDDTDAAVNPDVSEQLYNGKDDDCDRFTRDEDIDVDGYDHDVDCDYFYE